MKKISKRIICIVLVIVTVAISVCALAACNSGNWQYVTYYYNDELLEQERYWYYAWSFHGDKYKDELNWDKDQDQIMTTIKKWVQKLYSERGKKVFFGCKDLFDGEYGRYSVYSYSYGTCKYDMPKNKLVTDQGMHILLPTDLRKSHIFIAKDEP